MQNKLPTPDKEFQSLSCNTKNRNEFAVGTSFEVMIFDIRQMKEPRTTFAPDLGSTVGTARYNSPKPRQLNISWSPSGKYIFTHGPILWKYSNEDFPVDGDGPGESISCFWDVQNEKRIGMSVDATSLMEWSSGAQTWIDDNLVVGSLSGVHSIAPNSRTTENINDFEIDSNEVGACVIDRLAYNEKTFQLAGADSENIFIWSHYKLPPYPRKERNRYGAESVSRYRGNIDDFGRNDLRLDTGLINDLGLNNLRLDDSELSFFSSETSDSDIIDPISDSD